MGWPIKAGAFTSWQMQHLSVTFNAGISTENEASAVIPSTPRDRTVILNTLMGTDRLKEDGNGASWLRGCTIRQTSDTNLGLWITEENDGQVQAVTVRVQLMTFPENVIESLRHYQFSIQVPEINDDDWEDPVNLSLAATITDFSKAAIFPGFVGAESHAMDADNDDPPNISQVYLDPLDSANAKMRYQAQPGAGTNDLARFAFSVLELK